MNKYLVCLIASLVIGIGTAFADVEHTVMRGESIESIAEKYNVTREALIKANPGLDSLFYMGMKIKIPTEESKSEVKINDSSYYDYPANSNYSKPEINDQQKDARKNLQYSEGKNSSGMEVALKLSYGFIPKPNGLSQSPWAYAVAIGANYWFVDKLSGPFAGAMIGYDSSSAVSYIQGVDTEIASHFISIPISGGYALPIVNKKFSITPYIGFSPKFCVKSSVKYKSHGNTTTYDVDNKFSIDFNYGIALRIMGFNIIGAFSTPLNDAQKGYFGDKTYFSIGIGFGL